LIEDRALAARDVEGPATGRRRAVAVASGMHGALDLHRRAAARRRQAGRKRQLIVAGMAPDAVLDVALAGLVPALHEIVVHVGGGGAVDLEIEIVALARPG